MLLVKKQNDKYIVINIYKIENKKIYDEDNPITFINKNYLKESKINKLFKKGHIYSLSTTLKNTLSMDEDIEEPLTNKELEYTFLCKEYNLNLSLISNGTFAPIIPLSTLFLISKDIFNLLVSYSASG